MRIFSKTPGLLTSALLLMTSATGAYVSLSERERAKIGPVPGMSYATAPALKSFDDPRLARLNGESALDFATSINQTLFEAFYHCDTNDAARVVDRLATYLLPREYRDQGLLDLKSARCGFCHQSAFMLSHALAAGGVAARPIGLIGHVVSLVKIEGGHLSVRSRLRVFRNPLS